MSKPVNLSSYSGQSSYAYEVKTPGSNSSSSRVPFELSSPSSTEFDVPNEQTEDFIDPEMLSIAQQTEQQFQKATRDLLAQIEDTQSKINDIVNRTRWPLIEEAQQASCCAKVAFIKISELYFELSKRNYYRKNQQAADKYWQTGLEILKLYCPYSHINSKLNYTGWFSLSTFYIFQIQLHERGLKRICSEKRIKFIREGLTATDKSIQAQYAIQIKQTLDALLRKFTLLQLLKELNQQVPEPPISCLKLYLDMHNDTSSGEYLEYAQIYGDLLAKQGNLQQAKKWFNGLLQKRENSIFYLYLGKIEDHAGDGVKALKYFEQALKVDSQNKEIQLWVIFQKTRNTIRQVQIDGKIPQNEEIQSIVNIFNEFYSTFSECVKYSNTRTSTFISLRTLMDHLYATTLPDMANLLAQLKQFEFSYHLYNTILESFDAFVSAGILKKSEKINLYNTMGGLCIFLEKFVQAEQHLLNALKEDKRCLSAYQNLVAVYAHRREESKLCKIHKELISLENNFSENQPESLGVVFFNLGTAYSKLGEGWIGQAQNSYERSLKLDADNWDTRLHLARVLVITNEIQQAQQVLDFSKYQKDASLTPFGDLPQRNFQFYFCLSGILALTGNIQEAEKWAIEAGKTRINPEETRNLQNYLKALKEANSNKNEIHRQIKESIRKIEFNFRIGRIINDKSINFDKDSFVGYHGTIDVYLDSFKEGIKAKKVQVRQFEGSGFYMAKDYEAACYFAMKKMKEEGRGKPILLKIHASENLVGKEVFSKFKPYKQMDTQYDFLKSVIDGFEDFSQYYVFESNLRKLKVTQQTQTVDWSEERYQQFIKVRASN